VAKILVVDDSAIDRHITGVILQEHPDWNVVMSEAGREALARMAGDLPDLVVTDLVMPEMNGMELLETIRREYPGIPVVMMTAHGSEEIAAAAIFNGASSYVPKRNLARDLVTTVKNVLNMAHSSRSVQVPAYKPLVFISAKSDDYNRARAYHDNLQSRGIRVFLSSESLPELGRSDFRKVIDEAVDEAKHMIVVTSSAANVRAPWVEHEWGLFVCDQLSGSHRKKDGNLITVLAGEMPISDLPLVLRNNEVVVDGPMSFERVFNYVRK